MTRRLPPRHGLTMYEVVLSLAILLGSLAVLGQQLATGGRAATESRLRTQALLLCQSQMAEVIAGTLPLEPIDEAELESTATGSWVWSLQVEGGQTTGSNSSSLSTGSAGMSQNTTVAVIPHPDLIRLEVTVSRVTPEQSVEVTETLTRFIRNPQLYVEAAEEAAALAAETETAE